jgi:glycerol uptake facilitator-like aquaporin
VTRAFATAFALADRHLHRLQRVAGARAESSAHDPDVDPTNAAIASGATAALCPLFSRPISDASTNPARSLAPAIVSNTYTAQWIYVTAPLLGALVATGWMAAVHRRRHFEELESAGGEPKQ